MNDSHVRWSVKFLLNSVNEYQLNILNASKDELKKKTNDDDLLNFVWSVLVGKKLKRILRIHLLMSSLME